MRTCKKEYYSKIIDNNKNNMRGIWNILNSIVRRGSLRRQSNYPHYFTGNEKNINNVEDVVLSWKNS